MKKLLKELINTIIKPKVKFNDLKKIKPISEVFGFDRGTPIDRYYIDEFLDNNKNYIQNKVLEISESTYSQKYGGPNIKCEVLHYDNSNPNATIIGDLTQKKTLPENCIDCFICTQTFNFIYDVRGAINGAHHLLKENGVLLLTVAGLSQISRYDMDRWGDYWRFTNKSIQKLMEEAGFKTIEVTTYGNVIAAIALLQGVAVEDLPKPHLLNQHDENYQVIIGVVAIK